MCFPDTISEIDFDNSQLDEDELKATIIAYCDKVIEEVRQHERRMNSLYQAPRQCHMYDCISDVMKTRERLASC